MTFNDFGDIKSVSGFKLHAQTVLIRTLEGFFGASVSLNYYPINGYNTKFSIDITKAPKRNLYRVSGPEEMTILVVYVEQEDNRYYLGIQLASPQLRYYGTSIFQSACASIGIALAKAARGAFRSFVSLFNESLAKDIMIGVLWKRQYDVHKISYLTDLFLGLRSTTFEGKNFSTGLIITKSSYAYDNADEFQKNGRIIQLAKPTMEIDVFDKLETRSWFLADGYRTFFITNLKKPIKRMFIYEGVDDDYVGDMLLSKTLQGSDILFRVSHGRELSIINSEGYEFLHQENKWKFRDYNALRSCILERMPELEGFYDVLIKCVLSCSKSDTSSIIWVPRDINTINTIVIENTMNKFSLDPIKLTDPTNMPIIKRLLSSDGATVIDKDGCIRFFACFADLSKAETGGIRGTGESAALLLAQNGLAIKVSQDGPIKVFLEGTEGAIPF